MTNIPDNLSQDHNKIVRVISSCNNLTQLENARKLIDLLTKKYPGYVTNLGICYTSQEMILRKMNEQS